MKSYKWLIVGVFERSLFLMLASVMDSTNLKFTDVDYAVFSDAAALVNPYDRLTYRYTPLLAWLLRPVMVVPIWGKILFCLCDGLSAYFLSDVTLLGAVIWWINPMVAIISTRGSAESIMVSLVLGTLWALRRKKPILSAVLFGLSVHFKMYPIIYAIPFWFGIDAALGGKFKWTLFSKNRIQFGFISALVFLGLGWIMYSIYGHAFLQESYLYHFTRVDHRHNFSIHFYSLYMSSSSSLIAFLPQLGLVSYLGLCFSHNLPLALFCQTFCFVMLNKYFLWYLCLLPLVLQKSTLKSKPILCLALLGIWVLGQALWLYFAYRLEHLGHPVFRELWASSCFFYLVNCVVLSQIIRHSI